MGLKGTGITGYGKDGRIRNRADLGLNPSLSLASCVAAGTLTRPQFLLRPLQVVIGHWYRVACEGGAWGQLSSSSC